MRLLILFTLITLIVIITTWSFGVHTKELTTNHSAPVQEELPLLQFLGEAGKSYDCYFTIEEAWHDGESINQIESVSINRALLETDLQKALESLHKTAPNLTWFIGKQSPRIIHLMDSRLTRQGEYGMENVIKELDFDGTSRELVAELRKRGATVQHPAIVDISEARRLNSDARVKVVGRGLKLGTNEMTNLYLYR